ncbi:hypothetical protein CXG81DRAFT_4048, partial [Caulochytrium protostelioides]
YPCLTAGCGKSFLRRQDLLRHTATHSAVRAWVCARCEVSFTRQDALHRHSKT